MTEEQPIYGKQKVFTGKFSNIDLIYMNTLASRRKETKIGVLDCLPASYGNIPMLYELMGGFS